MPDAIRSRAFIGLYVGGLLGSIGVFVPFVHLVPSAVDHGIPMASAVLLLGAIGIGSTAGRFFLGGIADRWGRLPFLVAMFAGMGAALLIWAFASSFAALAAFALVFGIFYGGWVAIIPSVVMDAFGGRNVVTLIGILYTCVAFGTLFGPSAAGFMFDASRSYLVPILFSAAANFAAALVTWYGTRRQP